MYYVLVASSPWWTNFEPYTNLNHFSDSVCGGTFSDEPAAPVASLQYADRHIHVTITALSVDILSLWANNSSIAGRDLGNCWTSIVKRISQVSGGSWRHNERLFLLNFGQNNKFVSCSPSDSVFYWFVSMLDCACQDRVLIIKEQTLWRLGRYHAWT